MRYLTSPKCPDCGDELEYDAKIYCDVCHPNHYCECGTELSDEGDEWCTTCAMDAASVLCDVEDYYDEDQS